MISSIYDFYVNAVVISEKNFEYYMNIININIIDSFSSISISNLNLSKLAREQKNLRIVFS